MPPRADFLATMSADEREWMKQMKQHGLYLDQLLEQGVLVAHGPMPDRKSIDTLVMPSAPRGREPTPP